MTTDPAGTGLPAAGSAWPRRPRPYRRRPSPRLMELSCAPMPRHKGARVWFGDVVQPRPVSRHDMVGREQERAELAAAFADTESGRGRAVLLLGESGMGKSTLADWLVGHAAE